MFLNILYMQAGDTALINAAKNSHADVVELLLKCGAKTDHQNKVTLGNALSNVLFRARRC